MCVFNKKSFDSWRVDVYRLLCLKQVGHLRFKSDKCNELGFSVKPVVPQAVAKDNSIQFCCSVAK